MRKFWIILLLSIVCSFSLGTFTGTKITQETHSVAQLLDSKAEASTKDHYTQLFGPQLVKAMAFVILDEINVLRVNAGLPERTRTQMIKAIEGKWQAAKTDTTQIWFQEWSE